MGQVQVQLQERRTGWHWLQGSGHHQRQWNHTSHRGPGCRGTEGAKRGGRPRRGALGGRTAGAPGIPSHPWSGCCDDEKRRGNTICDNAGLFLMIITFERKVKIDDDIFAPFKTVNQPLEMYFIVSATMSQVHWGGDMLQDQILFRQNFLEKNIVVFIRKMRQIIS